MKKLLFSISLGILLIGCTTSQQTTAFNTIYSVEKGTTAAFDGYISTVLDGTTSTNGLPRVASVYNVFQAGVKDALSAVQFNTNALAPASLIIESKDVINTIAAVKNLK